MASSIPKHLANGAGDIHADAVVHTFDPEATPAQKAAAAGKGSSELKPVQGAASTFQPKEVAVDTGKGATVTPTITINDADAEPGEKNLNGQPVHAADGPAVPGAMPEAIAPAIPDWYKVGWRGVSGIDKSAPEGEELDKSLIEAYLGEAFYGAWYHNAAVIFFAVAASHFMTLFHMGWGWKLVLLAFCATYYSTSIARVRARARSDIQRELVKTRLTSPDEAESAEWINNFLDRFWLIYEPVLSATIVSSVDQILSASTPAFLDSLRLTEFTLGTKAPRIDKVHTFPRTADDVVMMDWALSFTPNDLSDVTPRQAATRVNPKIVLAVRVGKSLATATLPILLENLSFSGLMRIKLKLMTAFPHVQIVDISFMEKPLFDYVLKPLGGDTFGFDIGNIPGLSSFIRETVHSILGPMMYDPNVFTLNLEQMLSGAPIDAAIGVVQVYVRSASGLKGAKIGGGSPDPYASLSINHRAELAKTAWRPSTVNPTWNEVKFILVQNINDQLTFNLFDYNEVRKDVSLGTACFELKDLSEDATREGVVLKVLRDGKERGELLCDVSYFPVLKPTKVDGKEQPLPETKTGIVRLVVHQAKELDASKSVSGDLNPFAKVFLGGPWTPPIHTTPRFKHTVQPVWESATEFLCADRAACVLSVDVIDDRDFLKDPVVGRLSVRLADLLAARDEAAGRDWWPLSQCKRGKLRLSAEWKPLNMAGSMQGADEYVPPIGIMRLWLQKAVDVKNVEAALGGKSDPYVRVMVNNVTKARTEVINNNLNPEWDTIVYVPVHSMKEVLLVETMDYQHIGKDRSLGVVQLHVSDFAKPSGDNTFPFAATGKQECAEPLKIEGGAFKGKLHFAAEFVPAMRLRGVRFDAHGTEIDAAVERADAANTSNPKSSDEARPAHAALVPTASRPIDEDEPLEFEDDKAKAKAKAPAAENGKDKVEGYVVSDAAAEESLGVEMSNEEILTHQSGVVVFDAVSGELPKKARLEVLLDDGYWPAFSTTRARGTAAKWDQVGEGFIKELDFGKVWLRLNQSDEGEKDDIIAQFKYDAKPFLQKCLSGVASFTLQDGQAQDVATVQIAAKYIPVDFKLEPRESVNNQGVLRVTLLDGKDFHAADRSGKSDPYVVFTLNGEKAYKSEPVKKTLAPVWKESFEVTVPSRVAAAFSLEVFDWNQFETAKSLGTADVRLDDLEPFQGATRVYPLRDTKLGDKGEVRLQLTFQPEIIAKQRKATSVIGSAGRAMTTVGALPLGAGKGLVLGVGSAAKGAKGVFRRDHAGKGSVDMSGDVPPVPTVVPTAAAATAVAAAVAAPAGQASVALDAPPSAFPTAAPVDGHAPYMETGTLRVTIKSAKDLSQKDDDVKPYAVVRVGEKECKTKHVKGAMAEWGESFTFTAGPDTKTLNVSVHDHKTFGKDKLLGEADVDIWRHVVPGNGVAGADVTVELAEGHGLMQLRLEFERGMSPGRTSNVSMMDSGSPSRFISLRKRPPTLNGGDS